MTRHAHGPRVILSALALALALAAGARAGAQTMPPDPHIQSVVYDAGRIVPLRVAAGFVATVAFAADERIENVAVGNPASWQITANKQGDHLFVRPLQDGATTNLEVVTDARHYSFMLATAGATDPNSVFLLRFDYGVRAAPDSGPVAGDTMRAAPGTYRLSGAKRVRPSGIADDGRTTRICWPARAVIPAVFARDASAEERLLTPRIEQGCSVIDALWTHYRFVAGPATATAQRQTPRTVRP